MKKNKLFQIISSANCSPCFPDNAQHHKHKGTFTAGLKITKKLSLETYKPDQKRRLSELKELFNFISSDKGSSTSACNVSTHPDEISKIMAYYKTFDNANK